VVTAKDKHHRREFIASTKAQYRPGGFTNIGLILGREVLALALLKFIPEIPLLHLLLSLLPLFPAHKRAKVSTYREEDI
jgi:hypothetical protein